MSVTVILASGVESKKVDLEIEMLKAWGSPLAVTKQQAAQMLSCSTKMIQRWKKAGLITPLEGVRKYLIPTSQILALLENRAKGAPVEKAKNVATNVPTKSLKPPKKRSTP